MSPDNQTLLSNAHDSTVRTWDVRPFAPADRRIQTYDGAPTGQERNLLKASWDPKGEKIAAGSGDQSVAIWETRTGKLLNKLPGHRGAVNDVRFHPLGEPICKCLQSLCKSLWLQSFAQAGIYSPSSPNAFRTIDKSAGHLLRGVMEGSRRRFNDFYNTFSKHETNLASFSGFCIFRSQTHGG